MANKRTRIQVEELVAFLDVDQSRLLCDFARGRRIPMREQFKAWERRVLLLGDRLKGSTVSAAWPRCVLCELQTKLQTNCSPRDGIRRDGGACRTARNPTRTNASGPEGILRDRASRISRPLP